MMSMASSDAFGGFTFAAFGAKNILVVVAVMVFNYFFFWNQNYSFMYKVFLTF